MDAVKPSTFRALAVVGGLAFMGLAVSNLAHAPFDGRFDTTGEYVHEALSLAALGLTLPALLMLRRLFGAPGRATLAAVTGQALIVLGIAAGTALGEDPGWFGALAAPGLLLWLAGTALIGRRWWTTRALPRPAAVAIALTVPVGIVLAEAGGSSLPGLLWLWLGLATQRRAAGAPARTGARSDRDVTHVSSYP